MKLSKNIFVNTFAILLTIATCESIFAAQDPSFNSPLGYEMNQAFTFKKPLVIPFNIVSEKLRDQIAKAEPLNQHFTVTFTSGRAIRIADVFDEPQTRFDYQTSLRLSGEVWDANHTPDITFCAVTLKLTGEKNQSGYVANITRAVMPYIRTREQPIGINFGQLTNETFGGYVELQPSERPNPQTANGVSHEIPMIRCQRHANDNTGVRAGDFIKSIGRDKAEIRLKNFVRIRGQLIIETAVSSQNAIVRGEVVEMGSGLDRQRVEDIVSHGFATFTSKTSGIKITDCADAEITVSAAYGNFLPRPDLRDVYNAPKILDFQCHSNLRRAK